MGKISLSNIAEELAAKAGLSRENANNFAHAFVDTVEKGLQADGVVKVKGLGTFKLQEVSDRDSVDVNTGERITIKGYRKVTFTPDTVMKEFVNRPFAHFEPTELNEGFPEEEEPLVEEENSDDTPHVESLSVDGVIEQVPLIKEDTSVEENVTEEKIVTEEVAANEEDTSVVEENNIAEEVVNGTAEASLTEEVNHPKESLSQVNEEPNKRRTRRVWPILVVLLPVIALVGLYFYAPQGEVFAPDNRIATDVSDKVDVETDIVVNPHLEKEFVDELGRIPEPDLLLDSLVNDSSSANIKEVSGSVVGSSASVAEVGDTLVIIESLLVKDLKSITISDTLDYVIAIYYSYLCQHHQLIQK